MRNKREPESIKYHDIDSPTEEEDYYQTNKRQSKTPWSDELNQLILNSKLKPILVFPKLFEYLSFLNSNIENLTVLNMPKKEAIQGESIHEIMIELRIPQSESEDTTSEIDHSSRSRLPDIFVVCRMICIEDSDIGFSLKIAAKVFNQFTSTRTIILIGTCGSSNLSEEIGACYPIGCALKVDRGVIKSTTSTDFVVNFNADKELMVASDGLILHNEKSIISTNHIAECQISQNQELELYDMETFEFFALCSQFDITQFGALRIVSDIIDGERQNIKKVIRKAVSFKKAFTELTKIILNNEEYFHIREVSLKDTLIQSRSNRIHHAVQSRYIKQQIIKTIRTQLKALNTELTNAEKFILFQHLTDHNLEMLIDEFELRT